MKLLQEIGHVIILTTIPFDDLDRFYSKFIIQKSIKMSIKSKTFRKMANGHNIYEFEFKKRYYSVLGQ